MQANTTQLCRDAAKLGPGWRGTREPGGAARRQALASAFRAENQEPPPYLEQELEWVERPAKLFEAGDYPDKGVTISPADLAEMARRFDLPVPVLIEHSESPLELGYLTDVRAEGGELFGTVALTPEADALIRRSGARALSVGLSPDLKEIREVSLVSRPRVASAQLFHQGSLLGQEPCPEAKEAARQLMASGRLTPAQLPFAEALLSAPEAVAFSGGLRPVRELALDLLRHGPRLALFGELTPEPSGAAQPSLDPEVEAFYRRHFPDLSLSEIAQRR